jgi:hypothetical protein
MRSHVVGFVSVLATVALAAPNPKINEARRQLEDLELEKAVKSLQLAEAQSGNDRAQIIEILELEGIVYGTMGKDAKARDVFRRLLLIAPDAQLRGDHPPRVRTPFYEAKEWAASQPMVLDSAVTRGELIISVRKDPLRLIKRVRVQIDRSEPLELPLDNGSAKLPWNEKFSTWRLEWLGVKDAVLVQQGPFSKETPTAKRPEKKPETEVVARATPADASEPGEGTTRTEAAPLDALGDGREESKVTAAPTAGAWTRPVAYALIAAGAVSGGVGAVLGLVSRDAQTRLAQVQPDENGLVTSITQREFQALGERARTNALIANVLFATAGACAIAGALFFFLGASADTQPVTFFVTPWGGGVGGVFD